MKRLLLAAFALLAIPSCAVAPAAAQTVAGCGTAAVAKADRTNKAKLATQIACFEKAGLTATAAVAERKTLLAAIVTSAPAPTPAPVAWKDCAVEGGVCRFEGSARVRYGAGERWAEKTATSSIGCNNGSFPDPAPGSVKRCQTTAATVQAQPAPAPEPTASPTPTPSPIAAVSVGSTVPRDKLGVNVAGTAYFSGEQTFANLAFGQGWKNAGVSGWPDLPHADMTADGMPDPARIGAGYGPTLMLTPPAGIRTKAIDVTCTWSGKGVVEVSGPRLANGRATGSGYRFTWTQGAPNGFNWLTLKSSAATNPVRDIDCRVEGAANVGIFSAETIDYYRAFGVLRMLDVSAGNSASPATWATRTMPGDLTQGGSDGLALEHQVGLAVAADADPWLHVPWRADEDYVRRMAQLVHDALPAGRHAYVELSNEVWNYGFPVAGLAREEGVALKLADNQYASAWKLYARRTVAVMKIWADVFKDRPGQLVRVIASQSGNPAHAGYLLAESGEVKPGDLDALAIAPYFGGDLLQTNPDVADGDKLFPLLTVDMRKKLAGEVRENLAKAKAMGLRLISYEAGQHILNGGAEDPRIASLNRDQRMGGLYSEYIPGLVAANDNDVAVLFNASGAISKWGAWGLREYPGQPRSEAPKMDAALKAVGR
ncbi:hypothetical protein Q5H91_04230 [Sphingomonas sp. KR1UV-12]|uniref:Cellulose-binding protein n=1 Tax=Sphingomonas aurea TaxID=3063994 RepID=A0ABT9EHH2_9SPHN|nr:hypothetical protein [Sphingomonas sp. KR1UV-12]MDP1026410.1 hypothetical protein [Sphingomonas sp. KR1UV-12]